MQLGSGTGSQPFKNVPDYDHWAKRASQVPILFDQAIANMREGLAKGCVQPTVLMTKAIAQLDALTVATPEQSLFWQPIAHLPPSFSDADRQRITAAYRALIGLQLLPAYARLRDYLRNDYLPKTRASVGLDGLPDGAAWYAFRVRAITTTDLTPAQIHELGLGEVARIQGEIRAVMAQVGFKGDLKAFFAYANSDPRFAFASEDALLGAYNALSARVQAGVPRLFSIQPKAGFEIRPVEAFRAQAQAGGSYQRPSEDGSRPGIFYVNTYDLASRKTWQAESLFLREAIPGHHFQIGIQQELHGVPALRRFGASAVLPRMPNRWVGKSACTPIRISISDAFRPSCFARRAWSSIPACTPRAGPGSRSSTTCSATPARPKPMPSPRPSATWRSRARRWPTRSAS